MGWIFSRLASKAHTQNDFLWVESLSILFNHRFLFKNRSLFPQGFGWIPEKKDPWKEWGRYP